jgi:hypothetical protein
VVVRGRQCHGEASATVRPTAFGVENGSASTVNIGSTRFV